jgi:hypothetical protein
MKKEVLFPYLPLNQSLSYTDLIFNDFFYYKDKVSDLFSSCRFFWMQHEEQLCCVAVAVVNFVVVVVVVIVIVVVDPPRVGLAGSPEPEQVVADVGVQS